MKIKIFLFICIFSNLNFGLEQAFLMGSIVEAIRIKDVKSCAKNMLKMGELSEQECEFDFEPEFWLKVKEEIKKLQSNFKYVIEFRDEKDNAANTQNEGKQEASKSS